MTEKEEVKAIIDKYDNSISQLSDRATAAEFKKVMTYMVKEANAKQRRLVGLDKD